MHLGLAKSAAYVLKQLSKNYKLIIVSSTPKALISSFFKQHHVLRYFKEILGSDFDKSKVNKINYVLKKYRLPPQNCLFITDTLGDILEAKKCGIKSIAIKGGFHPNSTLRKGKPLTVVKDMRELPKKIKKYLS
jgi:phosphoglycolate phosphatase